MLGDAVGSALADAIAFGNRWHTRGIDFEGCRVLKTLQAAAQELFGEVNRGDGHCCNLL